jgi:hypothetical protein
MLFKAAQQYGRVINKVGHKKITAALHGCYSWPIHLTSCCNAMSVTLLAKCAATQLQHHA